MAGHQGQVVNDRIFWLGNKLAVYFVFTKVICWIEMLYLDTI